MSEFFDLFDWSHTQLCPPQKLRREPWRLFGDLSERIDALGAALGDEYIRRGEHIWVHRSAQIAQSAFLGEHCIVGAHSQVRHAAYVRGNALIGTHCVVGNSTEIKNSVLFDRVQAPHFNYIGDSVLGAGAHLGAGVILSNVKGDRSEIVLDLSSGERRTCMRKFGALVGDEAEIGCNSVLNPGTVIGRGARVYPLISVRGYVPPRHICKGGKGIFPIV